MQNFTQMLQTHVLKKTTSPNETVYREKRFNRIIKGRRVDVGRRFGTNSEELKGPYTKDFRRNQRFSDPSPPSS